MKRRKFLKIGLGASSALALTGACFPTFALSKQDEGFFELAAVRTRKPVGETPNNLSELWLYNGQLPGPAIRVKRGRRVRVRFRNDLEEPTSVHWHGIRIDNVMDGVAGITQPPVMPGESFDYDFVAPDAGTYWYHAHHMSWNQVPRGLAGPLIIEEDEPVFADDRDVTLLLTDWMLDENGLLNTAAFGAPMLFSHGGQLGNWLTVNGASMPDIPLEAGKWHRLRFINASSDRVLDIDPQRFGAQVIGYDGQTFSEPLSVSGPLRFAPGQRIDMAMRPEKPGTIPFEIVTGQPFTFANFMVKAGDAVPDSELVLPPVNALPAPDLDKARVLSLEITGGAMGHLGSLTYKGERLSGRRFMETGQFWGLNGIAGTHQDKPYFTAKQGETIVLETDNQTRWPHAMHIHGHHFQILEVNGVTQDKPIWRDTFLAEPGDRVKIAMVADNPGKWLLHCHMLGHAASGMVNWFDVV